MKKRTIIYIAGEGHSGTTMLDVILGSQKNTFSSGELINLAQKGFKNAEYCSCGSPIPVCEVWSTVDKKWTKNRTLGLDRYIQIQKKLTSKKNILSSYFLLQKDSTEIDQFLSDTNKLYDAIFEITDSKIIIDSSKAPGRLQILKKLDFDIIVIHLIRRFGDVLNSYKKRSSKDLKNGVEHDIFPLNSSYVFSSWLVKNLLTYFYSKGMRYKKIRYENLVVNPAEELSPFLNGDDDFAVKLKKRGPFHLKHLAAGNKLRMKDHIYIADKPMHNSYHRLDRSNKIFAKFIDFFY